MNILKLILIAVCGMLLAGFLKNVKSEVAVMVSLAVSLLILSSIIGSLESVVEEFKKLKQYMGMAGKYADVLIKVIGISYLTKLGADVCRDNGYGVIAGQLEIFCKITIALMGMPILMTLFEVVTTCIG